MIKNYSIMNHRGNELIKNLGDSTLNKSVITKDQFDNRFAYPTPSLVDGSGASAILNIDRILFVQTGKVIFFELNIEYDSNASTNLAKISGMSYPANGKFSGIVFEGVNAVHSYEALMDNNDEIQFFSSGVAVQNVALSNKTLRLQMGYVTQ